MNELLSLENVINKSRKLNNNIELNILNNNEDFNNILTNIIKKGIDYGIKSLNSSENNDGLVNIIKEVSKGKELKEIIKTCVDASISQALENKKGNIDLLKSLKSFKDISIKGGLRYLLSAGVDILFRKATKLNLFKPIVEKILFNVKNFIMSNSFIQKLDVSINKIINRKNEFKKDCLNWHKAYEEFNLKKINEIAKVLQENKNKIQNDPDCIKENNIIQNITKLVNIKKEKLSKLQLQICNDL